MTDEDLKALAERLAAEGEYTGQSHELACKAASAAILRLMEDRQLLKMTEDGLRAGIFEIAKDLGCEDEPRFKWILIEIEDLKQRATLAESRLAEADKILRQSAPEEFKHATSPVGCVQNYIASLELRLGRAVEALRHYRCDCDGDCEAGHKDSMACGDTARSVLSDLEMTNDAG